MSDPSLPRIAVFISGEGTNLQALIDAVAAGTLRARIALVVSNRAKALGLQRAERAGIPTHVAQRRTWQLGDPARIEYDRALASVVRDVSPDLLVLAGWMHVFSPDFLGQFPGRVINVNPSLLPAFPGRAPVADAIAYGVRVTGVTVHFAEPGAVDAGPIILQEAIPIYRDDTEETLLPRIHEVEHRLLPLAASLVLEGRVELRDGKVVWR